eukprot:Skav233900  [mRNA]  locus=scaffold435:315373:325557:+ [translate_table: standard]
MKNRRASNLNLNASSQTAALVSNCRAELSRFVKFKMMVHFHRKDGRWDVKPGALSDVDIKFGNGGAVEHMINTLLGIFGGVDQLLLETLWPMVATYIPENIVETLERVAAKDGQMAHHFKITGRCQQRMGERCGSSKVDFSIKDLTNVDVATSKVFPMYLSKLSPEKSAIEESVAPERRIRTMHHDSCGSACRPRSVIGTSLMFQQLLVNGHTSVGVRFSEREPLEEDGKAAQDSASLRSTVGAWGAASDGLPRQAAVLQISCGQEALERFEPQSLANIAWTWATLREENDPLIGAVACQALQQMRRFRPLPLTNLLWALATLRSWPWRFHEALASRVMHQVAEYNPQQLVNRF